MFEKILTYLKQEADKEEIHKQKIKERNINTYFIEVNNKRKAQFLRWKHRLVYR